MMHARPKRLLYNAQKTVRCLRSGRTGEENRFNADNVPEKRLKKKLQLITPRALGFISLFFINAVALTPGHVIFALTCPAVKTTVKHELFIYLSIHR